jgi:hypothetical protein
MAARVLLILSDKSSGISYKNLGESLSAKRKQM